MIDYKIKANSLELGLPAIAKKVSYCYYMHFNNRFSSDIEFDNVLSLKTVYEIEEFYRKYYPAEWKEAFRINQADYKRKKRLKARICEMIKEPCVFLTLTFTDDCLKSINLETMRKYVRRYLKIFSDTYIANIDFGELNERVHYHALAVNNGTFDFNDWKCGNVDFERVADSDQLTATKLAQYVSKLTNHAIKETTKRSCIIYSR